MFPPPDWAKQMADACLGFAILGMVLLVLVLCVPTKEDKKEPLE